MTGTPRIDFDALYRGQAPGPDLPAVEKPPWDTGAPKEAVLEWQNHGLISGDVLDIGCGFGDNAIYLTGHGHTVTALDIAPTALVTARERAHAAGLPDAAITFAVADATELTGYTDAFDTVVDSGLYHCLDAGQRARYAAAAHRATRAGARLLIGCFSEDKPARPGGPGWRRPGVSQQSLHDTLGAVGWDVSEIRPFTITRDDGVEMALWLVHAERR